MGVVEFVSAWLQGVERYEQGANRYSVRTAKYFVRCMNCLGARGEPYRGAVSQAAIAVIPGQNSFIRAGAGPEMKRIRTIPNQTQVLIVLFMLILALGLRG